MKKILVVAGGDFQVPLIKRAKALGYTVVNSNLYEDSIGFKYSDFSEVADVRDKEKNLEFAKKHQVDAIVTDQSDIAVPTVAYVSKVLGLPSIGEDMAKLYTDKYMMREFCKAHDIPHPEFKCCTSADDIISFMNEIDAKIIIKPLDSQASRGVHIIDKDTKDIESLYEDAASFTSDKKSVIAERFVTGTEFTVDGIVTPKGHVSLCISEKRHFSYNKSIASELFFSHKNDRFDYDLLRKTNNHLVDTTGLPYGLTHAEYKFENGKFYLIEIAARGGGTKISSDIVPIMTNVDNYAYLFCCAAGTPYEGRMEPDPALSERCCVLKFLNYDSQGKPVLSIKGEEEIRSMKNVMDFSLSFKVGDTVSLPVDDKSRVGYYIAYEESEQALRDLMKKIEETLVIEY